MSGCQEEEGEIPLTEDEQRAVLRIRDLDTGAEYVLGENEPAFDFNTFSKIEGKIIDAVWSLELSPLFRHDDEQRTPHWPDPLLLQPLWTLIRTGPQDFGR